MGPQCVGDCDTTRTRMCVPSVLGLGIMVCTFPSVIFLKRTEFSVILAKCYAFCYTVSSHPLTVLFRKFLLLLLVAHIPKSAPPSAAHGICQNVPCTLDDFNTISTSRAVHKPRELWFSALSLSRIHIQLCFIRCPCLVYQHTNQERNPLKRVSPAKPFTLHVCMYYSV